VQIEALQNHSVVGRAELAVIGNISDVKSREILMAIHIVLREVHVKKTDKVTSIIFVCSDGSGQM
jgi:hypothetical protein